MRVMSGMAYDTGQLHHWPKRVATLKESATDIGLYAEDWAHHMTATPCYTTEGQSNHKDNIQIYSRGAV